MARPTARKRHSKWRNPYNRHISLRSLIKHEITADSITYGPGLARTVILSCGCIIEFPNKRTLTGWKSSRCHEHTGTAIEQYRPLGVAANAIK